MEVDSMNIVCPEDVTQILLNSPAAVPNGTPPNPLLGPNAGIDESVRSRTKALAG